MLIFHLPISLHLASPPGPIGLQTSCGPVNICILPRLCNSSYRLAEGALLLCSSLRLMQSLQEQDVTFIFGPFFCVCIFYTYKKQHYIRTYFNHVQVTAYTFWSPFLSPIIFPFHSAFLYMTANHSLEFHHSLCVPYFKNQFLIGSRLDCFQFFTIINYAAQNSTVCASFQTSEIDSLGQIARNKTLP